MHKLCALIVAITVLLFASCSSPAPKETASQEGTKQKAAEPPQYETGRNVFQKLYVAAHSFAPDIKPYRLESVYTAGAPVKEGKSGIWRAQFGSASKRAIKSYTWSGLSGPDMPDRGISHGTEDTYNPSNASTHLFETMYLKVDSDKAFEVAQKHGGEKLTRKDEKQPVLFVLDWNSRGANQLVWHVLYGDDRNSAKLKVLVDATTGQFIAVEH